MREPLPSTCNGTDNIMNVKKIFEVEIIALLINNGADIDYWKKNKAVLCL